MFEKLVTKFVNDLIKTIDILYNIYNRLLNFEFDYLNISLIGFVNFLSFYETENLATIVITILGVEIIRSILNNKSIVCIIRSGRKKKKRRRSVNLFVVTVVVELNDIYFAKFLVFLLFTFIF